MPESIAVAGRALAAPTTSAPSGPPRPDALPGSYRTPLSPAEEQAFQVWSKLHGLDKISNTASGHPDPNYLAPDNDYDMRGFWKAMIAGDPNAKRAANLHFPDTWKTPYHHSFSRDSQYALPDAPAWRGDTLYDPRGTKVWDESWSEDHPRPAWEFPERKR